MDLIKTINKVRISAPERFLKPLRRKSFAIFRNPLKGQMKKIKMFWNLKKIVVYYPWCSRVIYLIFQEIL